MRFFTSISIAALCFVASIQAAPAPQLPKVPGADGVSSTVGSTAQNLPEPLGSIVKQFSGTTPGTAQGTTQGATQGTTQGATQGKAGGLGSATEGLPVKVPINGLPV